MARGPLFIVSGPSGVGKSTVVARVLERFPGRLRQSVSATTRTPRPGEIDGVHYRFWSRERFVQERDAGGFLEWAEVHGCCYGTPRDEVEPHRVAGVGVVLVIDVQGAAQVRACVPDHVSVFLLTSTFEELERRIRGRGDVPEEKIRLRLANARAELTRAGEYHHRVINDDLDTAVAHLSALVAAEFHRGETA